MKMLKYQWSDGEKIKIFGIMVEEQIEFALEARFVEGRVQGVIIRRSRMGF